MANRLNMSSPATLAERLARAAARLGTHSPKDIQDAVERGDLRQWVLNDSVFLASVHDYPQLREAQVFLAAGDLEDIKTLHQEFFEPWAIENGCNRLTAQGRRGWLNLGREWGYRQGCIMHKDLG